MSITSISLSSGLIPTDLENSFVASPFDLQPRLQATLTVDIPVGAKCGEVVTVAKHIIG